MSRLSKSHPAPDRTTERLLRELGVPTWTYLGTDADGTIRTSRGTVVDGRLLASRPHQAGPTATSQ
jgi:hypothetical protein